MAKTDAKGNRVKLENIRNKMAKTGALAAAPEMLEKRKKLAKAPEVVEERIMIAKAQKMVEEREKEDFIKSFENGSRKETELLSQNRGDGAVDFYYGVPAFENGKLVGLDMMTYTKVYDERGRGHADLTRPYADKSGKPVRFSVDEFLKFQRDLASKNTRPVVRLSEGLRKKEIEELASYLKQGRC